MNPLSRLSFLLFAFFASRSFADPAQSIDDIFAAENVQGVIDCEYPASEDSPCHPTVTTVDPMTGQPKGSKEPKLVVLAGGEDAGSILVYDRKKANATDSYFLIDTTDGRAWIRAGTRLLHTLNPGLLGPGIRTTFALNPSLQEVYLNEDGSHPISVKDIFALKNNPNEKIGVLEISLDMEAAKDPTTTTSARFSYPNHGERNVSSYQLLKATSPDGQGNASADRFQISLPVFRKASSRYLVLIPPQWSPLFPNGQGALDASLAPCEGDGSMVAWIESKNISLNWKPGANDNFPLFPQEQLKESPSVEFSMDQGATFQRNGAPWTSLKIYALYLDFDDPHPRDIYGNEGVVSRKKVFLRDIYFPLYDAKKRIHLWQERGDGC